jgi:exonuclease VII large subunit
MLAETSLIGRRAMFKNDFFDDWLDEEALRVQAKIKSGQALDADDKVLLILKAQVNHFHHLDIDLREEIKVLREDMGQRFEQVDKRFEQVDKRFEQVDKRFEQVDKRFEQMREDMDKRFEQTQEELKKLYQAINAQTWKMIGAIGLIVVLTRLAGGLHA